MQILGHSRAMKVLQRLADERRLAHGYLFFGPEGVGKRFVAESLAAYLENGQFAPALRALNDLQIVAPDEEGVIGIDAARALKTFLYRRPNISPYRLAIVDDAHRMTPPAQNALLKIAEEPPSAGIIIFITSDPDALFPTLRSRLHAIYFSPVPMPALARWLCDVRGCSRAVAEKLARAAFGAPGKAIALSARQSGFADSAFSDAAQLCIVPPSKRKELIKKIIAPEDFNLSMFLDRCIESVAEAIVRGKGNCELWHRLLALRAHASYVTLNPRIQLEALFHEK